MSTAHHEVLVAPYVAACCSPTAEQSPVLEVVVLVGRAVLTLLARAVAVALGCSARACGTSGTRPPGHAATAASLLDCCFCCCSRCCFCCFCCCCVCYCCGAADCVQPARLVSALSVGGLSNGSCTLQACGLEPRLHTGLQLLMQGILAILSSTVPQQCRGCTDTARVGHKVDPVP